MPIFEIEMREVTVYKIKVDAKDVNAAIDYGRVIAPTDIVEKGFKPVEESGLVYRGIERARGCVYDVKLTRGGVPIE